MLSLAKNTQAPRLARHTIYAFRVVLATVWMFWGVQEGLVLRLYGETLHGRSLIDSLGIVEPFFSVLIGVVMIFIAFWLLAGWASRACAVVQVLFLVFLGWLTYADGPVLLETVFEQIPMLVLIVMVWSYGPGSCVWARRRRRSTWTRG